MKVENKIFVVTHKLFNKPNDDCYIPILVGEEKNSLGYIRDSTGDNISYKNKNYCELTALYWMWKNAEIEKNSFIGLCHYRRFFYFNKKILSKEKINQILSKKQIIVAKKRNYFLFTIKQHYIKAHYEKDLICLKEVINEKHPDYLPSFDYVFNSRKIFLYNMFVTSDIIFDQYCTWLFEILFCLESKIDISHYDQYQKRVFGFIAERLFNVWIVKNKKYTIEEMKVVNIEGENFILKGIGLLKRQFKK